MEQFKSLFMFCPGGENEGGNIPANNNVVEKSDSLHSSAAKEGEELSLSEKIHEALQDWSNDDQRDQDIDDSRP